MKGKRGGDASRLTKKTGKGLASFLKKYNIDFCGKYLSEQMLIGDEILPENAVMFREGDAMTDSFWTGFLAELPLLLAMIWLAVKRYREVAPGYTLDWRLILVLIFASLIDAGLTPVHEIIHGLCYPRKAKKTIWTDAKNGMMFIHCSAVISRLRFLVVGLAPAWFLGVLPFGIWYLCVPFLPLPWSMIWVFVTWYMVFGSMGDFCNILHMVTQVPWGAKVMNYGVHSYWIRD